MSNTRGITFVEDGHKYITDEGKQLISVSQLVHLYTQTFDPTGEVIKRCAIKRNKTVEELRAEWDKECEDACIRGTSFHKQAEYWVKNKKIQDGDYKDVVKQLSKIPFKGQLEPERIIFNKKLELAGTIDLTEIFQTHRNLYDYKTNKKLSEYSFWDSESKSYNMMQFPVNHLMDCNFIHYCLQLSFYQLIEESNGFEIKNRELIYINPKSRKLERFEIPYLKDEVLAILEHYKSINQW